MSLMRSLTVAAIATVVLAAAGNSVRADNELKGGILGGAAGAGLGAVLGGAKGAAVGGVLGLGVGALGANQLSKPKREAPPPPAPAAAYPPPPQPAPAAYPPPPQPAPAAYPPPPQPASAAYPPPPQPSQAGAQPAAYPPPQYAPITSQREMTLAVQNELVALGYNPGVADGLSGPQTQEAIRAYQYQNGLPVDGAVSQKLLDHMRVMRARAAQGQQPAAYQPSQAGGTYTTAAPGQASAGISTTTVTPGQASAGYGAATATAGAQGGTTYGTAAPGQAVPLAAIDRSNCKPYQQMINIEGQQQMLTSGTACLQPDGSWRIVE
jgi:hypothetical protein